MVRPINQSPCLPALPSPLSNWSWWSYLHCPRWSLSTLLSAVVGILRHWICLRRAYHQWGLCLYSLSGKMSYRQISWSFEAARLDVIMIVSLWNLTGISAALLPMCLSTFRMIGKVWTQSHRFETSRDLAVRRQSRLVNRGLGRCWWLILLGSHNMGVCLR